ncbi:hypothetical protein B0T21DRAFT_393863 [Apiosordaria backusii]|uniref:Uncharacterized protein n=1 Tax=Apiosordaria backusii TaxID=314023 RepID=A0AA40EA15_9PEZI|nr:hypothetical protein B0T21DRAFT_393863 [Apiosordaria backusii]
MMASGEDNIPAGDRLFWPAPAQSNGPQAAAPSQSRAASHSTLPLHLNWKRQCDKQEHESPASSSQGWKRPDSRDSRVMPRRNPPTEDKPTVDARAYLECPPGDDATFTPEEKAFWSKDGIKLLPERSIGEVWITATPESVEAFGATMLHKANLMPRGTIIKISAELVPPHIALQDRETAIKIGHVVPACAACGSTEHREEGCAMPDPNTGAALVQCGVCNSMTHILDRCKKLPSHSTLGVILLADRVNMPQVLSGKFAFSDFLAEQHRLLGKTENEVVQIMGSLQGVPRVPWSLGYGRKIATIKDTDSNDLGGKKHPSLFAKGLHDAALLPRDPAWGESEAQLVKDWIDQIADDHYNYKSKFVVDRIVPSLYRAKSLSQDMEKDVKPLLFENFKEEAMNVLKTRKAINVMPHPEEPTVQRDWLIPGSYITKGGWDRPAQQPLIRLVTFGKFTFQWEQTDSGSKVLTRKNRDEKRVFAFDKQSVCWWLNTWLDTMATGPDYKICGREYSNVCFEAKDVIADTIFPAFCRQWRRQETPSAPRPAKLTLQHAAFNNSMDIS